MRRQKATRGQTFVWTQMDAGESWWRSVAHVGMAPQASPDTSVGSDIPEPQTEACGDPAFTPGVDPRLQPSRCIVRQRNTAISTLRRCDCVIPWWLLQLLREPEGGGTTVTSHFLISQEHALTSAHCHWKPLDLRIGCIRSATPTTNRESSN